MLAKKVYEATEVGDSGNLTVAGLVSVGSSADASGYERFAAQVAELEALERDGRVRISKRHHESSTGQRHVDLVSFIRLA